MSASCAVYYQAMKRILEHVDAEFACDQASRRNDKERRAIRDQKTLVMELEISELARKASAYEQIISEPSLFLRAHAAWNGEDAPEGFEPVLTKVLKEAS